MKQVLVWHNKDKFHRAQNLKVFVLPDEKSLVAHTLIDVAEENVLGGFKGPPEDSQDHILFGDQCAPGIEGSVVVVQRDTLKWGEACPECVVLDLAEVVVKTDVPDNSDPSCSSVSTIPPKRITMSGRPTAAQDDGLLGGRSKNPWVLFEFEHTLEVKQVVLLPKGRPHVKDLKVFVGMNRPAFAPGEVFMNDPVCGVFVPPERAKFKDYFDIDESFTFKGKFQKSPTNYLSFF